MTQRHNQTKSLPWSLFLGLLLLTTNVAAQDSSGGWNYNNGNNGYGDNSYGGTQSSYTVTTDSPTSYPTASPTSYPTAIPTSAVTTSSPTASPTEDTEAAIVTPSTAPPTGSGGGASLQQLDCTFRNSITLIDGLLTLQQIVNKEAGTITVEVTLNALGWVAFGTSPQATMPGGEVVIAKPDEAQSTSNPGKYILNGRSEAAIALSDQQTLIDSSFEQTSGQTILRFTKLLAENGETEILADGQNTFIYAAGSSNTFGYHGGTRGSITLPSLTQCVAPTGAGAGAGAGAADDGATAATQDDILQNLTGNNNEVPNKSLWIAHGILMAISWAIFIPLGIGFSLLRKLVPGQGLWFKIHASFNSLAFLLMTAGFGIAVYATSEAGSPHFTGKKHRTIGLVIYVLAFVQVLGGICRPHLPHASAKPVTEYDETNQVPAKDIEASDPSVTAEPVVQDATPPKSTARIVFEIGHRIFGFGLLGLSWYNLYLGIVALAAFYGAAYNKTAALWGVIGGLSGLILVLYIGQAFMTRRK